jgi:hypothetical protein
MIVVASFSMITRRAVPRSFTCTSSSVTPMSSRIALAPVNTATSSSSSLRRSPKPGAFTAQETKTPCIRLTTSRASTSASSSSTMMRSGRLVPATRSRMGISMFALEIFFSWTRIRGLSSSHESFSGRLTK